MAFYLGNIMEIPSCALADNLTKHCTIIPRYALDFLPDVTLIPCRHHELVLPDL